MTDKRKNIVFISGNTDITEKDFVKYYLPQVTDLIKNSDILFNIGADYGCSEMLQELLFKALPEEQRTRVNIFYLGDTIENVLNVGFVTFGGFKTLEERNAAMTLSSNLDYHIVLPGKGKKMVSENIVRRQSPEYNYMKHAINGNERFWSMFYGPISEPEVVEDAE